MNTLRCFNKKMLVAATASVVLGMGMAGNASAAPFSYAVAYNNVWNWSITDSAGNSVPPSPALYTSEAHAELTGNPPIFNSAIGSSPPVDAPHAILGQSTTENNFALIGRTPPSYGRGDAVIWSPTNATNIGETYVTGSPKEGGGGGMNTLSGTITLLNPTTLTFKFDAHPYIEVEATGTDPLRDWAQADINFALSLANGGVSFNFAPNGILDPGEILDPFSLNEDRFANSVVHGPLIYDPLGLGAGAPGTTFPPFSPAACAPACTFMVTTGLLAPGNYNLSVSMEEHAHASVPEPATMLLLGGGLMGMAFATRRRTAAKA